MSGHHLPLLPVPVLIIVPIVITPVIAIIILIITTEDVYGIIGLASLGKGIFPAGELVIVSPQQTREGDIDEGSSQSCLRHHIHSDGLGKAAHIPNLCHTTKEWDVGNSDEGVVGVTDTFLSINEIEFPAREIGLTTVVPRSLRTLVCRSESPRSHRTAG